MIRPKSLSCLALVCILVPLWQAADAHVTLEQPSAAAGASYRAVLRVSHGCEGTATHTLTVTLPDGFRGAKPMPKPGWVVDIVHKPLAEPYESHGRRLTEDVVQITWRAGSLDARLADAHYDEFVIRGQAPQRIGPAWFKVLQMCEKGQWDWSQIPAEGTNRKGLTSPAVPLEVQAPAGAEHRH